MEQRDPLPGSIYYQDVRAYRMVLVDRVLQENFETVVQRVSTVLETPQFQDTVLAVDETGVGAAVTDMMKKRGMKPRTVTITGGDTVSRKGYDYRLPKRGLASTVAVLVDSRRVKFPKWHPLDPVLRSELDNFKAKTNQLGHDSYGAEEDWREGNHNDLVLASALALWFGENVPTSSHIFQSAMWDGDVNSGIDAQKVLDELA